MRAKEWSSTTEGVFLGTTKNAFIPIERVYSVNTYVWILLFCKGVSEVSARDREQS